MSYSQLCDHLKETALLDSVQSLLAWDEQVNLPPDSAEWRAGQCGSLAKVLHARQTSPSLGKWLAKLEKETDPLTADEKLVIREARRDYDRNTKLPETFVERKTKAESLAYHAWTRARNNNDFKSYLPFLREQLDLATEEAGYFDKTGSEAYDYWIDRHDPGMTAKAIEKLFTPLQKSLVPFAEKVLNSPVKATTGILKNFPVSAQETFLCKVIEKMGFDFKRGRIDTSVHPFCSGNGADTRLTTRFDPQTPLDSLFGSIHETGHGLYEQGLPREHYGTALGQAVGMAVHESQSRLWENQIGRSRAFWQYWEPLFRKYFPEQLASIDFETLYLTVNAVERNPIRVDADEVTYNLHIILRFTLEKALFNKELRVKDLPSAWNEVSRKLLGLTPKNDTEGVLQDVHWSGGAFGYFPSYCLGNMIAAQLWESLQEALPNLDQEISQGNYSSILQWLRQEVHAHGKKYDTGTLVRKVTGKPLSPKPFLKYLDQRYGSLYLR